VGEAASEINGAVEVVADMAVQTDLLAFTAAIEAARAGEHGVGFSIVAEEVRKLAERNAEAARGIARQIEATTSGITRGSASSADAEKALRDLSERLQSNVSALGGLTERTGMQSDSASAIQALVGEMESAAHG